MRSGEWPDHRRRAVRTLKDTSVRWSDPGPVSNAPNSYPCEFGEHVGLDVPMNAVGLRDACAGWSSQGMMEFVEGVLTEDVVVQWRILGLWK